MAAVSSPLPDDLRDSPGLLQLLLDTSPAGIMLLAPRYEAAGAAITDFAWVSLNPAAQLQLGLPACPAESWLTRFPTADATELVGFFRDAYASGAVARGQHQLPAGGRAGYCELVAQRYENVLVVSFTEAPGPPRPAAEEALRASQARAQQARAATERQRRQWEELFWRAPAAICIFDGPEWVYQFVNPGYQAMFPGRELLGKRLVEALPEVADQPLMAILHRVYDTGEPFQAREVLVPLARTATGPVEDIYFDLTYLARYNEAGQIDGFITYANDVTEQVRARRQREAQQGELQRIFEQAPVGMAVFRGPRHIIEMANDLQLAIWGRPLQEALGQGLFELLPELAGQGFEQGLAGVLATGTPFVGTDVPASYTRHGVHEQVFVSFVYTPLRGADGHIEAVVVVVTNTTEQVRARRQAEALQATLLATAQRQVQQREELYQVFEQAPAAIVLLRAPSYRIEYVNPAYQQLFPHVALRGQLLAEAHPSVVADGTLARLDRVYATGEPYVGEEYPLGLARTPGQPAQTRYFNFIYQPYREEGRTVGVSLFAYDVTAAALTRRLAAQQARQFRELYEHAPMAVCILRGPAFVVELANPAILRIWGLTAEEALGRPRLELIPEVSRASLRAVLETAYRTRQPHHVQELPVVLGRTHSGQPDLGYFNFIYQPLFDEQGEPVALTCVGIEVTEQVLARQAVEASARQLRLITDALPVLIGYLDREERYQFANEAYRAWFGQDPGALLGRPVREVVGEAAYAGVKQYIDRALAGERLDFESWMPYREGFVKYIRTSYVPDEREGQRHGFYTLVTDITEQTLGRQQVEQLNHELEARVQARTHELEAARAATERERTLLQALLTQAPVAIGLFQGEEIRVTAANERLAAMWGYTPAQVVGRPLTEGVPELRGQGFDELLRQVLRTQVPITGTETPATMLRDGELKTTYYNFVYQPLYDTDGQVLGVIDVATEVTEQVEARRRIEQLNQELETRVQERTRQLTEQQALLRQILGQVPAAIATMSGPEHRYTFFNEPYQAQVGQRAALGWSVAESLPEVISQGYLGQLNQVYASGERYEGREVPFQLPERPAGGQVVHYLNFVYEPLADGQGRTTGILLFAIDVTEQVLARQLVESSQLQVQGLNQEMAIINEELTAANEELQVSNAQLTRTNVDLDTFVYTASHDLKAPITNIEGILHALRDTLPGAVQHDPVVAQLLGLLDHTVERFRLTIDQLTDLSRLQQTYNEPRELLLLAPVVADVLADLAPAIAAAQAQLYLDIPAGLRVSFAPSSLRSVVYNLLSNAVKYRAPERPAQVWLQAKPQAGTVELTVRDNGLGLTATQQQRLFGVFQRLHTHVEGTGVGLYMIKRLIENAGASITVTSVPNVGSTFTVTFAA